MTAVLLAATTSCAVVFGSDDGDGPLEERPEPVPSPAAAPLSPTPDVPLGDQLIAQETLARVWDLPAEHRTYPLLHRLGQVRLALASLPHSQPWVRELDGQILAFTAQALPPTPSLRALPGQLLAR